MNLERKQKDRARLGTRGSPPAARGCLKERDVPEGPGTRSPSRVLVLPHPLQLGLLIRPRRRAAAWPVQVGALTGLEGEYPLGEPVAGVCINASLA